LLFVKKNGVQKIVKSWLHKMVSVYFFRDSLSRIVVTKSKPLQ
jgi:hypothetical protein